jgi:hypothetical protein
LKENAEASSRYDLNITLMDWEEIRKHSEKISGLEGEVGTEHLPNMILELYRYTNPSSSLHSEFIFIAFRINPTRPRIIVTTLSVSISSVGAGKAERKKKASTTGRRAERKT